MNVKSGDVYRTDNSDIVIVSSFLSNNVISVIVIKSRNISPGTFYVIQSYELIDCLGDINIFKKENPEYFV